MFHDDVYRNFKIIFPQFVEQIIEWFPNGKNSIRIRLNGNCDFIFIYDGPTDWCFETLDRFINKLIGKERV